VARGHDQYASARAIGIRVSHGSLEFRYGALGADERLLIKVAAQVNSGHRPSANEGTIALADGDAVLANVHYAMVYLLVRTMGKRELAQMMPFELIALVVFGDLIKQGVTHNDFSKRASLRWPARFCLLDVGQGPDAAEVGCKIDDVL
jgi:hypothetical protein